MHMPRFFSFDVNFVSLLFILYHASCLWQLQLKNFMMMMMYRYQTWYRYLGRDIAGKAKYKIAAADGSFLQMTFAYP